MFSSKFHLKMSVVFVQTKSCSPIEGYSAYNPPRTPPHQRGHLDSQNQYETKVMSKVPATGTGLHLLVVIDHHEAKVYSTEVLGAVPERIKPYDPTGHGRHLHSFNEWSDGKSQPEKKSFYDAVAKTLRPAEQILLFGSGTGKSNAMDHLLTDLKQHHADIAAKVVGSVTIDASHTTEGQLLAKAREFYAEYNKNG